MRRPNIGIISTQKDSWNQKKCPCSAGYSYSIPLFCTLRLQLETPKLDALVGHEILLKFIPNWLISAL